MNIKELIRQLDYATIIELNLSSLYSAKNSKVISRFKNEIFFCFLELFVNCSYNLF